MTDVTRDAGAPEGHAAYTPGQLVAEDRRESRIGIVVRAWDREPPVLYKLAGATDPKPWIAWEHHLRPATPAEAAAYESRRSVAPELREASRALDH